MLPVKCITIHHDGMSPFTATDFSSCASRIELIRNGHRGKGWADIGYHFVIDRSGRVWEGRDIRYQGAHVKDQNEGNLGILCVGNFDQQTPSMAQLAALDRHLRVCMLKYKVKSRQVLSHQEWASAHTACPGRNLQSKMDGIRRAVA
jgi:N-acetyl-anhydromuramyl-L-alanine amidase AmpD